MGVHRNLRRSEECRAREREAVRGCGGLAPSGVQGQSPWSGGLGDEVPQKQTIFNSLKGSFLMNNNINSVVRIFFR